MQTQFDPHIVFVAFLSYLLLTLTARSYTVRSLQLQYNISIALVLYTNAFKNTHNKYIVNSLGKKSIQKSIPTSN